MRRPCIRMRAVRFGSVRLSNRPRAVRLTPPKQNPQREIQLHKNRTNINAISEPPRPHFRNPRALVIILVPSKPFFVGVKALSCPCLAFGFFPNLIPGSGIMPLPIPIAHPYCPSLLPIPIAHPYCPSLWPNGVFTYFSKNTPKRCARCHFPPLGSYYWSFGSWT